MLRIGGIQKTTLIDFPRKVAAIVFTQGCNFRCGYCHNPELLSVQPSELVLESLSTEKIIEFLTNRIGRLDGVVITGGEPTLQSGLYDFIREIKTLGFAVKLDTNGTNPKILEQLIKAGLLDYIAMDIKAPLKKYREIVGIDVDTDNIIKSINLIMSSSVEYEFRTTVLKSQLAISDLSDISKMIKGAKKYYLQKFIPSKIYDSALTNATTYTETELKNICNILKQNIYVVDFR